MWLLILSSNFKIWEKKTISSREMGIFFNVLTALAYLKSLKSQLAIDSIVQFSLLIFGCDFREYFFLSQNQLK